MTHLSGWYLVALELVEQKNSQKNNNMAFKMMGPKKKGKNPKKINAQPTKKKTGNNQNNKNK